MKCMGNVSRRREMEKIILCEKMLVKETGEDRKMYVQG